VQTGKVGESDASTGAVVQTIAVDDTPYGVSSDGTDVWVTNLGGNAVSEINILGCAVTNDHKF